MNPLERVFAPFLLALVFSIPAQGDPENETILYQTDFSDFPVGDGNLVGHDGWTSTHLEEDVYGIEEGFFGDDNRSGALGFFTPKTTDQFISVFKPLNYDPIENRTPVIEFSANIAIVDSEETEFYDSFHISVFNSEADLLAGIVFDNTEEHLGIWRSDGLEFYDTDVGFEHFTLYELRLRINFEANTWSAWFGDNELFADAPFTSVDKKFDLGDFSAEWELTDVDNPGDNWMLFDDWTVKAISARPGNSTGSRQLSPRINLRPNGNISLHWRARPNTRYQVEHSDDLSNWKADLPDSLVTATEENVPVTFVDRSRPKGNVRYYRVRRLRE